MPIDIFSRERFEAALPTHKQTSQPLWKSLGLLMGEYCYVIPVNQEVEIYIRSSLRSNGFAADTGNDSIRCYLVDSIERKPITPKSLRPTRWITRVSGWEERLTKTLRILWRIGRYMGTCPACKVLPRHLNRVKKPGPNQGKLFVSCDCNRYFKLLEDPEWQYQDRY